MSRTNEHGQPIGAPVPGWTGCEPPARVVLAGRYVRLEPVSAAHVPDLYAALCGDADDALWTYRFDPRPRDEAGLAALVAAWAARPSDVTFAILPEGSGRAAGLATLMRVDAAHGSAEVGAVVFARSLQRTRAATEAIHLLAAHLFDDLGYRRFEWKLDALNAPSARAARRLGFSYEGRFRQAMVYKGRNRDTAWFAMTDADWPAVRAAHRQWLDPANFDEDGRQRVPLSALTAAPAGGTVVPMDQRVSFVTLAARDLDATRAFYVDGLGWTPALDVPGEVLMIKVGERVVLSLWDRAAFEAEVGPIGGGPGLAPITLAHNVATREEVDAALDTARRAGADPVHAAEEREWGGYTGYFGDPDGYRWEVAWNPGPIGQEVLP